MSLISLIILFSSLLSLGIISIILDICKVNRDKKDVRFFVEHVTVLKNYAASQEDTTASITYILANYQEVSNIFGEGPNRMPVFNLGRSLSSHQFINHSLYTQVIAEEIEFLGAKVRETRKIRLQLLNPFVLIYRGVELIMGFAFGYIICKFNPEFKPARSITWQIINTLLAIAGSTASILSYFNTR